MTASTRHHRNRQQSGPAPYLGWSHRNSRMEMMDLAAYLDSMQRGYDSVQQAYGSMLGATRPDTSGCGCGGDCGGGCGCGGDCGRCGGKGERHRHHDRARDCGCRDEASCRCDCCIEDADIVVYAHCGERRIVPIEIENDTRKPREDVSLDVSDVRTAGGRVLDWPTATSVDGPLTLDACSTRTIEVVVQVDCRDKHGGETNGGESDGGEKSGGRSRFGDVDECVVGYFTVRLGGCLTRPIVVAVAALPYSCDSYRAGCACSCCH